MKHGFLALQERGPKVTMDTQWSGHEPCYSTHPPPPGPQGKEARKDREGGSECIVAVVMRRIGDRKGREEGMNGQMGYMGRKHDEKSREGKRRANLVD